MDPALQSTDPSLGLGLGLCVVGAPLAWSAVRLLRGGWPVQVEDEQTVRGDVGALLLAMVVYKVFTWMGHEWLLADRLGTGGATLPELLREDPWMLPTVFLVQLMGGLGSGGVAILWAIRSRGLRTLGLAGQGLTRATGLGLGAWLLCLPLFFGLASVWRWAVFQQFGRADPQDWVSALEAVAGAPFLVAAFLGVIVLPFLEELTFRGFVQPMLVSWLGVRGGVILTALFFSSMHDITSFLPIFGLALLLGGVMQRTKRLGAVFAIHAFHNGVQMALLAA